MLVSGLLYVEGVHLFKNVLDVPRGEAKASRVGPAARARGALWLAAALCGLSIARTLLVVG